MWTDQVTISTTATRNQIWEMWSNVEKWNEWDHEVETSTLFGEFKKGSKGMLKPKGAPKSTFEMVEVNPLQKFVNRSSLPFTTMDFIHVMEEKSGKLYLTHKIEMKGPLTFLFSKIIGKKIIKELPVAMKKLTQLAVKSKFEEDV